MDTPDVSLREEIKTFVKRVDDLLKTPQRQESEILHTKYTINQKIEEAAGKHGEVFFVSNKDSVQKSRTFAVKRQPIKEPARLDDKSYRELIIFQSISSLAADNKCINFVELIEWFKATPDLLSPDKRDKNYNKENKDNNPHRKKPSQLMHFVLEYADGNTLADAKQLNLVEMRSILFQVMYALAVAQQELEFVHNDLHLGNILLKSMPLGKEYMSCTYNAQGHSKSTWFVSGFMVKITDFGLSRIKSRDGQVIYNTKDSYTGVFTRGTDVENLFSALRSYSPKGESLEEQKLFRAFKKRMANGEAPVRLLQDSFFASLKDVPDGSGEHNTIYVGDDPPLKALLTPIRVVPSYPSTPQASNVVMADVKRELIFIESEASDEVADAKHSLSDKIVPKTGGQSEVMPRRSSRIKQLTESKHKSAQSNTGIRTKHKELDGSLQLEDDVTELSRMVSSLSVLSGPHATDTSNKYGRADNKNPANRK